MESVDAVVAVVAVTSLCFGIFVILVCTNRQLSKQVREMEEQILDLVDRIQEQRRDFKGRHPGILEKNETLKAKNRELRKEAEMLQDELSKITDALKEAHREIKERPVREWQEWLKGLTKLSCSGEIEVEVKFILPLVKYLGYRENDFKLRHAVYVQVGREKKRGQADWVLYDRSNSDQVRAVIEAKAPNQRLDNRTQEQARSYAFALGASVYALTEGRRFQVFRCRVQGDTCVADCDVRKLGEVWPKIHQEMGVGPGIHGVI